MAEIELHLGGEFTGDSYDVISDWIDRNGIHHRPKIVMVVSDDQLHVSHVDKDDNVVESFAVGVTEHV